MSEVSEVPSKAEFEEKVQKSLSKLVDSETFALGIEEVTEILSTVDGGDLLEVFIDCLLHQLNHSENFSLRTRVEMLSMIGLVAQLFGPILLPFLNPILVCLCDRVKNDKESKVGESGLCVFFVFVFFLRSFLLCL